MRLKSDWLMDKHLLMEEWRYASMVCGAQYVMIDGISEMHKLCANNLDMKEVCCMNKNLYYLSSPQ